jgi:outer membrane protein assembly factor BamB
MRIDLLVLVSLLTFASPTFGQHRVATQGAGKLVVLDAQGDIEWDMPWGGIHDIHELVNGHLMVQHGGATIVELDPETKEVVWEYDSETANGNQGKPVEVHSFQPVAGWPAAGGRVMIAESGVGRIIEVNRKGEIVHETKLKVDHPHPHRDTRLVRKLDSGNYLVCHEGDGVVREYAGPESDNAGDIVWEFEVPLSGREPRDGHGPRAFGNAVFGAVRLDNGNTLVATGNGHSVLEVTPQGEVVWKLAQRDLDGITLAWVTTLEVLPNGHYVIGNCHAGPDNPVLVEIDPATKKVVWQLDAQELLGNDVSNTLLLDVEDTNR